MSLVVMIKGKEKTYLFSDNCQYLGGTILIKDAPRQFPIQKLKNFVIGYYGSSTVFSKLVKTFEFDSFPEPLTKSFLMRHFYMDFLDFLTKETKCDYKNEAITDSDFGIMILGKNYAFDIGPENLYEVRDMNLYGDDRIASSIYDNYSKEMPEEELIRLIMKKSVEYAYKTSYPFLLVTNSDLNHISVFNMHGTTSTLELKEMWRKE